MPIRPIQTADAAQMIELNNALDSQTTFMLMEPGERIITLEQQIGRIQSIVASHTEALFVVEDHSDLVGYVAIAMGIPRRTRHVARIVIGVKQTHWGQGIGRQLLDRAEHWAREAGIHRLELTVVSSNARAISLYRNHGFVQEGVRADALRIAGAYVDESYMAKLI